MEFISTTYALITGGAKRLAKEIAVFLAKKKYNIIIHYYTSQKEAKELKTFLQQNYHIQCILLQANFNNHQDILNIFNIIKTKKINVTTLINSASSFHFDDFFNYEESKWVENFNTNLKAPYILSKEFAKYIKEIYSSKLSQQPNKLPINQNNTFQANIINMVDSWSYKIDSRFLSYNLAKLSLWRLTKIMALELSPYIRVNGVAPGLVVKPENMPEERFKDMCKETPIKSPVNPEDIAKTIWTILNTPSICGEIIKVDGGKSLLGTHPQ